MLAQDRLREGRLEEALDALQARVRTEPGDPRHRIFLFQLLAVLEALGQRPRHQVFAGRATPPVIGEPEEWMAWLVEALRRTAAGDHARAAELRASAFDAAPATPGAIDEVPFEWIADADVRLGPMLEVVVHGRYAWLPLQRVRAIRLDAPADLRDLVWTPAFLTLETGAEIPALVPTRYPGSEASADAEIRRTEWHELDAATGCWVGAGQRMLATAAGEHPLMDVRLVRLGAGEDAPAPGAGAGEPGRDARHG